MKKSCSIPIAYPSDLKALYTQPASVFIFNNSGKAVNAVEKYILKCITSLMEDNRMNLWATVADRQRIMAADMQKFAFSKKWLHELKAGPHQPKMIARYSALN